MIGTLCDIFMLTMSNDEFWEGVQFGALQDTITTMGYPIGGDTIFMTSGVVSRIKVLRKYEFHEAIISDRWSLDKWPTAIKDKCMCYLDVVY